MGRLAVFFPALALVTGVVLAGAGAGNTIRSRLDPGWYDQRPVWSPNGTQILVSESYDPSKGGADYRLALVRPDGRGFRLLSRPRLGEEVWDLGGAFSPDGRLLLVTRELGLTGYVVLLKDVVTGTETRLTSQADDGISGTWSPDGSRILVVRRVGIPLSETPYTERPDGTDVRRVAAPSEVVSAVYLPGATRIVLTRWMHGRGSWIAVVPANGGTERRLTPTGEWALADAAPDGKRVLLVSGTDGSSPALWIANVDGSGRRLLVRGANGGAWSHDGAWIAYTAGEYTKDHAIHLVHPDGTGRRVLVGRGRDPAWSPDGRTIAYSDRGPCLNTGVYTISLASGQARRLTQDCHLVGTARADVLLGTSTRDLIRGGAGDDVIRANPGDRPNAYFGQFDDDVVDGGPGNDTIFGGRDPDVLRGGPGDDRIFGGRRRDRLVGGPGRDLLEGGRGNDFIDARDGVADVVRCGPGVDRVLADSIDLVERGCEHIARR